MSETMKSRRAELLDDIVAQVQSVLLDLGLTGDRADQAGHAVADHLAVHWGGQVISIPKEHYYKLSERDQAILAAHSAGTTLAELCKTYEMGERGMRKLLRRARARSIHLSQQTFTF